LGPPQTWLGRAQLAIPLYFSFEGDNAVLHVSHFGLVKLRQAHIASTLALALKLLQGHTSTVSVGSLLALNAPGSITLTNEVRTYPSSTNGTTPDAGGLFFFGFGIAFVTITALSEATHNWFNVLGKGIEVGA